MADSEEWFVGEDGCLSVGKPTHLVTYHSGLNTILISTKEPSVNVIDVTSGSILAKSDLSASKTGNVTCEFLPATKDRVLFCDGNVLSVRRDLNGVLLLDTALQTPILKTEENVKLELPLPEANSLFKCLMGAELQGVEYVEDVLRELEKEIEVVQQATKGNHKVSKWATVCVCLPHLSLRTVCSSLVAELKRLHQHVPGLPVASAITDRLTYMLQQQQQQQGGGMDHGGAVDRTMMYSEAARRDTFHRWPHMKYKWALPDPMAQAGFYHQPSSTGDDRAMCFTCNVCLVCWEPTDEPWSEHERHSPQCPFVKGEWTQNVPLSVSFATEPGQFHGSRSDKIECTSTTSCDHLVATSTLHGNVVIWDFTRQLKKHVQFNIDPWEPVVAAKTGTQIMQQQEAGKTSKQEAWGDTTEQMSTHQQCDSSEEDASMDDTDAVTVKPSAESVGDSHEEMVVEGVPQSTTAPGTQGEDDGDEEYVGGKMEVIEVGGAWKQMVNISKHLDTSDDATEVVEIELDDIEPIQVEPQKRCRPSQDVLVSALCVLASPSTASASPAPPLPSLISGVAIRRSTLALNDLQLLQPSTSTAQQAEEEEEVQCLNQVNQALSGSSSPQIITEQLPGSSSTTIEPKSKPNPFIPYLLIHDIAQSKSDTFREKPHSRKDQSHTLSNSIASTLANSYPSSHSISLSQQYGQGYSSNPQFHSYPQQNSYPPPIMDIDEESDVQIVGMSPPNVVEGISGIKFGSGSSGIKFGTVTTHVAKGKYGKKINMKEGSSASKIEPLSSSSVSDKEGSVVQCVELPSQVDSSQYVHSITPSLDGRFVVVVTAPKCLNRKIHLASTNRSSEAECEEDEEDGSPVEDDEAETSNVGCVIVYRVDCSSSNICLLHEKPVGVYDVDEAVTEVVMLPKELSHSMDEEDASCSSNAANSPHDAEQAPGEMMMTEGETTAGGGGGAVEKDETEGVLEGYLALTTVSGCLKVLRLQDFKVLATIKPNDGDKIVSAAYCSSMDRLCCATEEGKLHFYIVHPKMSDFDHSDLLQENSPQCKGANTSKEDIMDIDQQTQSDELLIKQPLSSDTLTSLHSLTQFENLMPRYMATVPQCWLEIQQEQQQRRHPQHLQQQGEANQHTRSWKLQQDSTSWDEHMFELILPKHCTVGHVDVKFSLHPLCTSPPNVQVTLLKQNLCSIGSRPANDGPAEVDTKINFKEILTGIEAGGGCDDDGGGGGSCATLHEIDTAIASELLGQGAQVVCGPVDLASFVDMSGHSGVLTLTSPQLFSVKAKSFLLHLKAVVKEDLQHGAAKAAASQPAKPAAQPEPSTSNMDSTKPSTSTATSSASVAAVFAAKMPQKGSKNIGENDVGGVSTAGRSMSVSAMRQKLDSLKGCDWLQELSITIRKCKKQPHVNKERVQRIAMLETSTFHEQLLLLACGETEHGGAEEHRQKLALEILTWILAVNTTTHKGEGSGLVLTIQCQLGNLVRCCFLQAGRAIAHQCAKLISLCIECAKSQSSTSEGVAAAASFNLALLHALLDSLRSLPQARSAGAVKWFFTLLNRVKCMDICLTGQVCTDMMAQVAREYNNKQQSWHALLKARFGLYGNPLDPELFDIDLPPVLKATLFTSLSGRTGTSSSSSSSASASQESSPDDQDFRDLLSLSSPDRGPAVAKANADTLARNVCGLLEVEPLHFTCNSTSDSTKLERADIGIGNASSIVSDIGSMATSNFGESLSSVAGAALASLQKATATAEQQLSSLQHKHLQLSKLHQQKHNLEQKLAESSNQGLTIWQQQQQQQPYNSELFPPTPKNTPFFMTPPLTPPNESYQNINHDPDPGKPPKVPNKGFSSKDGSGSRGNMPWPASSSMFQAPPPQMLVIERMHSGARRFVVLDFGKPILLTDVIIPASTELASLSIDTWVQGEEHDGQRLVVSNDIGIRSLILNNMMPPAVCRYLKITTIGKYSGGTTKSRISIGSFYGHSYILPWEIPSGDDSMVIEQPPILQQLSVYMALLEDIQCRYSLAATRLQSLLTQLELPQPNSGHTQYYLKRGSKRPEDDKIQQAYSDCVQLQLQMNIAGHAIDRLQRAAMTPVQQQQQQQQHDMADHEEDMFAARSQEMLRQASGDKLRVLSEQLLDSLLSMTYSTPTIPQLPVSLYTVFTPLMCETLFRNLCVNGTRKMQLYGGILLVRLCGNHTWWGDFLGSMLQEYFSLEQQLTFPQDRVFILLTALGQKSLGGAASGSVLESLLTMLAKLLSPLLVPYHSHRLPANTGQLDLSLVGWLLLFLSKCLDQAFPNSLEEDKSGKESPSSSSNRWDFIQGDSALHNSKHAGAKSTSARLYRRKLQKRLMHHKQHLLDLQAAKKNYMVTQQQMDKTGAPPTMNKETEILFKQHEALFKKQLKQYSSKHFKDLINIRRTDSEILRKLNNKDYAGGADDGGGQDGEAGGGQSSLLLVARDRCIPVVRGLMSLLLSMDFTCNVDLFIITTKVVARLCQLSRPAVVLAEVMSQEQLEHLLLLICNMEHNHANNSWGGAWAPHAITCLLQDVLEGEKLYPSPPNGHGHTQHSMGDLVSGVTDDEAAAAAAAAVAAAITTDFTDDSLPDSTNLPTMDDSSSSSTDSSGPASAVDIDISEANNNNTFTPSSVPPMLPSSANKYKMLDLKKDADMLMNMLMETQQQQQDLELIAAAGTSTTAAGVKKKSVHALSSSGTKNMAPPGLTLLDPILSSMMEDTKKGLLLEDNKKGLLESWKSRLGGYPGAGSTSNNKASSHSHGVSTAMDARLEFGVELNAEMRLRVMLTMEAVHLQNALSAPLPPALPSLPTHSLAPQQTDDDLSLLHSLGGQLVPSTDMLSMCFNNLFTQLPQQRVSLDSLLLAWLTLDDEAFLEVKGEPLFDPSRVPSIPLNQQAVSSLLAALAWSPVVPVRTWVLAFHTLSLLANLKCGGGDGQPGTDRWLATCMVADSNMMTVLLKFLSAQAPMQSNANITQVGPTANRAFTEFLVRLQLRCAEDNETHLKEMLLKLIYTLSADRGAFAYCQGPLDAQCRLVELMVTELTYDSVDVSNAISVIESITALVHQHISTHDKIHSKSSSESTSTTGGMRSCFGALFSGVLRGGGGGGGGANSDSSRDSLMCSLLKLLTVLVQIPVPSRMRASRTSSNSASNSVFDSEPAAAAVATPSTDTHMAVDSPMTDFSKMSQSLGQQSGIMTSTPNLPAPPTPADEQQTDEQKTETAAAAAAAGNISSLHASMRSKTRSCTHYTDPRHPENEVKEAAVADIILAHPQIMVHLLQALSHCNSHTVAMLLGGITGTASMHDTIAAIDPITVGDGIFHVLCTLNKKATDVKLVLKAVYSYMSSGFQGVRSAGNSKLSEPLLWFILRVLDCERASKLFLEMGGVEVICRNLVSSNQRVISTSPSLISTIMQHLASTKVPSLARKLPTDSDPSGSGSGEGMQNFAPLGTISSSSPSAGPADVLIQSAAPHRRARSAAWSYHFYPDEAWVDITISLPCAILLKEVQIQPHLTSLATCPGAVTLEASRDGVTMIPLCSPVHTSGLTCIKIQLLKPEVVSAVTVRLHKPNDSTTIGLSQILLNGYTAFGESSNRNMSTMMMMSPAQPQQQQQQQTDDYVAKTSLGWLRLLHHCLTLSDASVRAVAAAAAPTTDLLVTCTALLVSPPAASVYSANIEAVLLLLGLYSIDMGLALIHNLLRNTSPSPESAPMHGRVSGIATDSSIDLLYQLGMNQDQGSAARVEALCEWLGDSARLALHKHHGGYNPSGSGMTTELPSPAPAHVHCVAAVLWHSHEMPVTYNLQAIVNKDLLSSLYEWSSVLSVDSPLKRAVDCVICSACYIHPDYFCQLLEWQGIPRVPLTDDNKEDHPELMLTDDSKAGAADRSTLAGFLLADLQYLTVDEAHLMTLAVACQSPHSLRHLLDSGLVAVLCHGLFEFCMNQIVSYKESLAGNTAGEENKGGERMDASSSADTQNNTTNDKNVFRMSADQVAPVLKFLAEISKEVKMKDWLGNAQGGSVFWPLMLHLLCTSPSTNAAAAAANLVSGAGASGENKSKMLNSSQRTAIENQAVEFFTQVISCHPLNQHRFALALCEVIKCSGLTGSTDLPPLSGFLRRLFLQVLLEDEKLVVTLRSASQMYKSPSHALTGIIHHPRCGAGHKHRTLTVSLTTTCSDIMAKTSDAPLVDSQILGDKKPGDKSADKKDTASSVSDALDRISQAAGLSAQEKRDKGQQSGIPYPRPPSRRGYRLPQDPAASSDSSMMSSPSLHLCHSLMPGQPLPSDLSLGQLLTLLHDRGLNPGQSILQFSMKLKPAKSHIYKADKRTRINAKDANPARDRVIPPEEAEAAMMDEMLMDTAALPSALQVFASVGGLALLAEHLPLMYPEISRSGLAGGGAEGGAEKSNAIGGPTSGMGHDWVTIESSEDMYEELYEPIPPSSQPPKLPGGVGSGGSCGPPPPNIPPHSLVAFGLFLRLPGYAEVLLREKKKARCLLRLVLGVTDDGEGGHILSSSVAPSLPTLPFTVLKSLYASTPLTTDDGVLLRRMTLDIGCVHLILACLSVLSHHAPRVPMPGLSAPGAGNNESNGSSTSNGGSRPADKQQLNPTEAGANKGNNYWAKGTGFGTGSTISSWDAEQALLRQKSEEQHVACLLQVLASYINPGGDSPSESSESPAASNSSSLPTALPELLSQSCLVPAISSYLRNDSVLDMARHIPLYHALLLLLRSLASCEPLVPLLLPLDTEDRDSAPVSVVALLDKIKTCVDTYASRLKTNKGGKGKNKQEEEECEGLAQLIPDIQETASIVQAATSRLRQQSEKSVSNDGECGGASRCDHSLEQRYMHIMKELQFDTYEIVRDDEGGIKFAVPHHYESNVKAAGDVNNPGRARRLAQEAVTLSTSLPLSYSSSVFVRCDEDRLDVMKVLITGPSETPYSNGCFEFDIFFPQDYPNSPPLVNLETTGNQTVRFNPNLYNDGKVCLSVLNTWHGRPEEKWNTQTSSFLQVLVSIQSLILVSEPYFNEPGYERSRHTPTGMASSREYDANIRQAAVKWAMLEMMKNPSLAFKEVIDRHFWMKKDEICAQIEEWIQELEANSGDKRTGRTISHSCIALKRHYHQLKEEFAKMKPPADLVSVDDDDTEEGEQTEEKPSTSTTTTTSVPAVQLPPSTSSTATEPAPTSTTTTPAAAEPTPTVIAEAAEMLASSTVESALSAAVHSVLEASGAMDSDATNDAESPVSADSTSGLVYVDDGADTASGATTTTTTGSKTDAEKSQEAALAAVAEENDDDVSDLMQYL